MDATMDALVSHASFLQFGCAHQDVDMAAAEVVEALAVIHQTIAAVENKNL